MSDTLTEAQGVREKIKRLQSELDSARSHLNLLERRCLHLWTEPKYTPEYQKGYTIEGDPPGTMGVDWRGPCEVPAKTIDRWTRTCKLCGTTQTTERTNDHVTKVPSF